MKPPVLISTDFDGTLTLDAARPPLAPRFFDYVRRLRRSRRVVWVINTGRDWASLRGALDALTVPFFPDWVVLLEREAHRVKHGRRVPLRGWNRRCAAAHTDLYARAGKALARLRRLIVEQDLAAVIPDGVSPFGILARTAADTERVAEAARSLLSEFPELTLVRNTVYGRFAHADYHKGSCLAAIAEAEHIAPENTFAAGDHLNDVPMLDPRHAGCIACPSNAVPPVKRVVRAHGGYVAKGKAADGVVEALEFFFGKQNSRLSGLNR